MPEYHMPINSHEAQKRFDELDNFTKGYVEASLWLFDDEEAQRAKDWLGNDWTASFDDIAPEALAAMIEDCRDFQQTAGELLEACASDHQAGVDFWLTRNGHGAGFWDRGLGEAGDKLTELSKPYGECDLYSGDDGRLYIS